MCGGLHWDITGPFPEAKGGVKYVAVFVNELTGWLGAYALEQKSLVDEACREHVNVQGECKEVQK